MFRTIVVTTVVAVLGCSHLYAQETTTPGPGIVEATVIPVGVCFFPSKKGAPSFGNYGLGAGVTYNINRLVGVEGDFAGMIATTSDLQFGTLPRNTKAPNILNYNVDVLVYPVSWGAVFPYAGGGIGGLTMFERVGVGVNSDNTFFVGNIAGGLKWYAPNSRWGLRGEYRFLMIRSSSDAAAFFGQDNRYGHRLFAGLIVNTAR
jgi:hypothetical protein